MTRQKKWLLSHPLYSLVYREHNKEKINKRRRELYQLNKKYYVKKDQNKKYANTMLIRELKSVPCKDCNIKYPYYIMHFDHRNPSTKLRTISAMATYSKASILKEIEKCDVVCANCHAERTHQAVQNGKIKIFGKFYV